ncbi:MAG: hypothetical protein WD403_08500, partial [Pirellulales bacterium]
MSGHSGGSTQIVVAPYRRDLKQELLERIRDGWARGEQVTADELLKQYPEVGHCRSVILDLALEEYSQRVEAGAPVDRAEFCRQFGVHENVIRKLLSVNRLLLNPDLVPGAEGDEVTK